MSAEKDICKNCGEPRENHVEHGFCAGQPMTLKDEFPRGYKPTKFEPELPSPEECDRELGEVERLKREREKQP